MKIQQIKILQLNWGQLSPIWHPLVIEIETDQKIVGYGEAGVAYGAGVSAVAHLIQELGQRIIGKNPLLINQIWQDFYEHTFWAKGGGTLFYSAISAIDIALWDIKGKTANMPIYQLLGGKITSHIHSYASHIEYGWGPFSRYVKTPHDFYRIAKRAVDDGYQTIKLDPIDQETDNTTLSSRGLLTQEQLNRAYERTAAVRQALGPNKQLILDCHANLRVESAIQLAHRLLPLKIYYFEEPVPTIDPHDYDTIADQTSIPLAVGEHLTIAKSFAPYIRQRNIGIVQPDLGTCGGFTMALQINSLALVNDINLQLHVCGSPIATAAALQFEAAMPNFLIHENHEITLKQAYRETLIKPLIAKNGVYEVSTNAGLGVELSDKARHNSEVIIVK